MYNLIANIFLNVSSIRNKQTQAGVLRQTESRSSNGVQSRKHHDHFPRTYDSSNINRSRRKQQHITIPAKSENFSSYVERRRLFPSL